MIRAVYVTGLFLFAAAAIAADPTPQDFSAGLTLQAEEGKPVQELVLPAQIYVGVTRADLSDLRVFNAEGVAVPHALCPIPAADERPVSEVSLRIFPLQQAKANTSGATHVEVQTAGGTEVKIEEPSGATPDGAAKLTAHIMDARELSGPVRALRLRWDNPDGGSELRVRIETSEDLDHWRTLDSNLALLRTDSAGQRLERSRLPLPEGRYSYLRIERSDDGPAVVLHDVTAEVLGEAVETGPEWFNSLPQPGPDQNTLLFESGRLAPINTVRIVWPAPNMALHVTLSSRHLASDWTRVWAGDIFTLGEGDQQRSNEPIRFSARSHRYWQIKIQDGAETLANRPLRLQLGYLPLRLRFLAQQPAPYLLAFGSQRVKPAPAQACDRLLRGASAEELAVLIGQARFETDRVLGGDKALTPAPKPTPVRRIVLWAVLILGTGLLASMAVSLFKRLKSV